MKFSCREKKNKEVDFVGSNLHYICVTIVLIIIHLLFYLRLEDFLLVFENCKRKGNKLLKLLAKKKIIITN